MATLIKDRARRYLAAGPISVGYGNYSLPLMESRKHITLRVESYMLRIEWEKAK